MIKDYFLFWFSNIFSYEKERKQIEVNDKAALILNLELNPTNSGHKFFFSTTYAESKTLLVVGIIFFTLSTLIFGFACYHKRKYDHKEPLNLGRNANTNGNYLYKEVVNSDEETAHNHIKSNFKSKKVTFQNKINNGYSNILPTDNNKLLSDEDGDNDSLDDIFIR